MARIDELRKLAPDHPVFSERRVEKPRPEPEPQQLAKVLPFQRVKPR